MRHTGLGLALAAAVIALAAPPARAQTDPQKQSMAALVSFSVAYGVWLWEARCNTLPTAQHTAFKRQIEGQLLRLNGIFDEGMVGVATGTGRDTAADPKMAACDGQNAGLGKFGLDMAKDVDTALSTIPAGFRLVVKR